MFYFGVDYYPEQWPRARWGVDARLMAEAGFNIVRLAEFAWATMEPLEGQFDFSWLDDAIAILAEQGIRVILGTPTASPPPWLMHQAPEVFRVREDGIRLTYGNRREYCPNNPSYQEHSRQIVSQMAAHYANHPAVIGWQIDNEFGDRCYCPVCCEAFQEWLCRCYGSLDALNDAWGTAFWSHRYSDWSQIPTPAATGHSPNPGLALDYYRFSSDSYVAYQQAQIDLIRRACPSHWITHNLMGFGFERINYFDLARGLDFVSWDNYRRLQWRFQPEVDPSRAALDADTMRGLKRQNFWVMEQQAGPGGWEVISVAPRPGELRLWAYQSIAHGADAILFFRWRTARYGTEQYWHGLLDHDGTPGRRYQEIKQMGGEIKRIGDMIHGSMVKSAMAMVLSYDSRFAFQIQANNPQFSYPAYFYQVYRAFYQRHVSIDVISATDDLSAYKLVVIPTLHIISAREADNLARFVQAGGILMVGPRSGVKDETNAVVNKRLPGLLSELCGVVVEEYDSLTPQMGQSLSFALDALPNDASAMTQVWCDILQPQGAEVVARYTSDYYAGKPAITIHRVGAGSAVYVGTCGNDRLYEILSGWLLDLAQLRSVQVIDGLEVAERWQGNVSLLFVLNHGSSPQELKLDATYHNLIDGQVFTPGSIMVKPCQVLILAAEDSLSLS